MHKYILTLLIALFVPILATVAINFTVDPFLYRSAPKPDGIAPAFTSFDREVHLNLISQTHPRAVLLGNSQVQHAFNPTHWHVPGPVINASGVGVNLAQIREAFERAQTNGQVDNAIIGLDFTLARKQPAGFPAIFRNYVTKPDGGLTFNNIKTYFSFSMLKVSLLQVRNAVTKRPASYSNDGQALDLFYKNTVAATGGPIKTLTGRLKQMEGNLKEPASDYQAQLRAIRDDACRGGTHLTVFFTPLHVSTIEATARAGRLADWEQWKRDVVTIANENPACRFDVWDFNTYNEVTTDPLPEAGKDFVHSWDGIHFRPSVGDQILSRIAQKKSQANSLFGVTLTPETIEKSLVNDRVARQNFMATHDNSRYIVQPHNN